MLMYNKPGVDVVCRRAERQQEPAARGRLI